MTTSRKAIVRGPNDGELIDAGGDRYRFLAVRNETDGCYGLWEAIVPPGGGPPPHLHRQEEEGFYIIEGQVTVHVDGEVVIAGPGSFVNMPKGSQHWFRNDTDRPAKMLVLVAPGGMEAMFHETGTPVVDVNAPIPSLSAEEKQRIVEASPKFGIEIQAPAKHE